MRAPGAILSHLTAGSELENRATFTFPYGGSYRHGKANCREHVHGAVPFPQVFPGGEGDFSRCPGSLRLHNGILLKRVSRHEDGHPMGKAPRVRHVPLSINPVDDEFLRGPLEIGRGSIKAGLQGIPAPLCHSKGTSKSPDRAGGDVLSQEVVDAQIHSLIKGGNVSGCKDTDVVIAP